MTDTVPAAAIGLPAASNFDRRSFLATLASAGVLTASAEIPAIAGEHPDAKLLEMVALYDASHARQEEHDRQVEEAFARYREPPIPEALFVRDREPRHLISSHPSPSLVTVDGEDFYFFSGGIADLTRGARQYARLGEDYSQVKYLDEEAKTRIREIKQAHQNWRVAVQAAEDAAGITRPRSDADAENAIMDALATNIIKARASTIDGIRCKARFALLFFGDIDHLEKQGVNWLLERGGIGIVPALGASLIVDIIKLQDASPAQVAA